MRFKPSRTAAEVPIDMTPMIDMTFQLIAFFMLALNFSEAIVDQTIKLPISELARPPELPPEQALYLNMNPDGTLNHVGRTVALEAIGDFLAQERAVIRNREQALGTVDQTVVVIRADADAAGGKVQELIQLCQRYGFEKFILRAKQEED